MFSGLAFDLAVHASKPSQEKVLEVPAYTVGSKIPKIVDVHVAVDVRVPYFRRIDLVQPVPAHDAGRKVHVESLKRVAGIGILVDAPVQFLQVFLDCLAGVEKRLEVAQFSVLLTVEDIGFGRLVMA
jgi:hypothetical protein